MLGKNGKYWGRKKNFHKNILIILWSAAWADKQGDNLSQINITAQKLHDCYGVITTTVSLSSPFSISENWIFLVAVAAQKFEAMDEDSARPIRMMNFVSEEQVSTKLSSISISSFIFPKPANYTQIRVSSQNSSSTRCCWIHCFL
jgi:hypothetical protein